MKYPNTVQNAIHHILAQVYNIGQLIYIHFDRHSLSAKNLQKREKKLEVTLKEKASS